ncbi:MAG: histidine kinase [Winogradskyella sp.]|uniref:sensor histidine kinase n=1 Tax=Winogradskyella sp. TaxID=1883156 RepID=UPI000F3D299E|nr:sensor histidine kinase [Winogradskyella sp.]RNC87186.1 MAG: histidine kinase [Winogradskyella sp.]
MQNLNLNTLFTRENFHRPLIFNSVLWSLSFIILLFIFSKGKTPIAADIIYTLGFLILVAVPVNINFYVLIPKFLKHEKYSLYFVCFIANLVIFSFISSLILYPLLDTLFPNYFFVSYLSKSGLYIAFIIILTATTLFKLTEDWFYFNRKENELLKLQNLQIQTQLLALKAQINPHFLFNSLNVIYAMALEEKKDITKAIVELSDVLRYVIYDSDTEQVSLKDELKLINNYISFQKYRGQSENKVNLNVNVEDENFNIYPMLLLPLLENSYKYGFSGADENEHIDIELYQKSNQFRFSISNSKLNTDQKLDDNYSGVGLKNLENNLNLVYPNRHTFKVTETEKLFKVTIELNNED